MERIYFVTTPGALWILLIEIYAALAATILVSEPGLVQRAGCARTKEVALFFEDGPMRYIYPQFRNVGDKLSYEFSFEAGGTLPQL